MRKTYTGSCNGGAVRFEADSTTVKHNDNVDGTG